MVPFSLRVVKAALPFLTGADKSLTSMFELIDVRVCLCVCAVVASERRDSGSSGSTQAPSRASPPNRRPAAAAAAVVVVVVVIVC